jgi:ribosomal protein L9
MAPQQAYPG